MYINYQFIVKLHLIHNEQLHDWDIIMERGCQPVAREKCIIQIELEQRTFLNNTSYKY